MSRNYHWDKDSKRWRQGEEFEREVEENEDEEEKRNWVEELEFVMLMMVVRVGIVRRKFDGISFE